MSAAARPTPSPRGDGFPDADSTLGVVVAQQGYALAFALALLALGALGGVPVLPRSLSARGVASISVAS